MNIVVRTASGKYIVRPDTTWEKDNENLYLPEFVDGISYTPVLFARICKPGRSIGRNFAARYYDAVNYGVLLYPESLLDGSEEAFACASCLDHTSFLPFPLQDRSCRSSEGQFDLSIRRGNGDEKQFRLNSSSAAIIESAIVEATRFIYIRSGDLIAIELQPREMAGCREDGRLEFRGNCFGQAAIGFDLIY